MDNPFYLCFSEGLAGRIAWLAAGRSAAADIPT
jgi:hypothetical protein